MKRNFHQPLPNPIPDGATLISPTGYKFRVRRRGLIKYHEEDENGKLVTKKGDEWTYYLVHDLVAAGQRFELTGSVLFTHSKIENDGCHMVIYGKENRHGEKTESAIRRGELPPAGTGSVRGTVQSQRKDGQGNPTSIGSKLVAAILKRGITGGSKR